MNNNAFVSYFNAYEEKIEYNVGIRAVLLYRMATKCKIYIASMNLRGERAVKIDLNSFY